MNLTLFPRAAVSRFVALAPAQRSCVILKDVLGHSLEEIAALLQLSVPAVKAALHRGRTALRDRLASVDETPARPASPIVARYAALFNARDWDGVRGMLADDVRLDLVARSQRAGGAKWKRIFSATTSGCSTTGTSCRHGSMAAKCWPSTAAPPTRAPPTSSS